ncbi:hypothetical protein IFM89_039277, partial [Coptis chinensis]
FPATFKKPNFSRFGVQMTSIKRLPKALYSSLRSNVVLFDLTRVVEELVYNSIDAASTKVNVAISVAAGYVKVEDDGCGITRDGLVLLGERYATSKFHCLAELDVPSENFGFRGEAISSLSDISLLEVTTKARGRPNGYRKIIKACILLLCIGCKCLYLGIDDNRQEMGTTVVVRDLFYNQPVRRKCMQSSNLVIFSWFSLGSPKKVLDSVKKCVLRVAIVHPQVSFRVTDIESVDEVLHTHPSASPLPLVSSGFGIDVSCLCELNFSKGIWELSGYISVPVDTCSMKDQTVPPLTLTYPDIDSRFVCKGPIHKLINNLADSYKCLDIWKGVSWLPIGKRSRTEACSAYILNLRGARSSYDLTFEPSKTTVEFKDWVPVLSFVEQAIRQFWRQIEPQGEPLGKADVISRKDEIWKKDDIILSPIKDICSAFEPEITKNKHRKQHDRDFLQKSSFSLEIAPDESDLLLHPKKYRRLELASDESDLLWCPKQHRRPSEEVRRNAEEVKGKEPIFHQADYTLQGILPTSWDAYSFRSTPVVSQEHSIRFRQNDNDLEPVEDSFLSSILTGRQISNNVLNESILGSSWGTDFVEDDGTMNGTSAERLQTRAYVDHKNEVLLIQRFPKDLKKPFLRRCSLLENASPLGNISADRQSYEIKRDDKFRIQRKQLDPDDVVDTVDSDQNIDVSCNTSLRNMFGQSSALSSQHTLTDLNVLSADFISPDLYDEVSFTEEIGILNSSPEQFRKRGSLRLSMGSARSLFSPYSPIATVSRKSDHFNDEYAANGNYTPCTTARSFRDREIYDELSSFADIQNSSIAEDRISSCTDIDLDPEYSVNICGSLSPGCQSTDSLTKRVGSYTKSAGNTDWLCLDMSVTSNTNNCAAPNPHSTSCNHEELMEQNPQNRGRYNFWKYTSRRSHSAPPFYKGKNKFSSIYNCITTTMDMELSSPNLQVFGDFQHSSQFYDVSQNHCEHSPSKESPQHSRTSVEMTPFRMEYIGDIQKGVVRFVPVLCESQITFEILCDWTLIVTMTCLIHYFLGDFISEEVDLKLSGMKWRDGHQQTAVEYETNRAHNLPEQIDILDISSGVLQLAGSSVVPESISKDCLKDAKILIQLDKKFIPVVAGMTLAVIDQHAADERIRLEEFRRKVLSGEGKSVSYLESEQDLVLPEAGFQLLQNYSEQIQKWGWICNVHAQGSGSFTKNLNLLNRQTSVATLLAVPCILGVNLSNNDLLEFLDQLAETDGSSTLPPSVVRVLNSKACRSAIMFGDALLPSECSLIIEELKQTSLCFQCAHGRPTTVPIVNLEALRKQIDNLNTWNVCSRQPWHGLVRHRPSLERARQRLIATGDQQGENFIPGLSFMNENITQPLEDVAVALGNDDNKEELEDASSRADEMNQAKVVKCSYAVNPSGDTKSWLNLIACSHNMLLQIHLDLIQTVYSLGDLFLSTKKLAGIS